VERAGDRVGAAVERLVEALRLGVAHDDLALMAALRAAQVHPPRVVLHGRPVEGVHVVRAAGGTELEGGGALGPA
jgi:hypothetical protein